VCVWSRGYVNGSGGWICGRQASLVACGVSTTAVDPETSWDETWLPSASAWQLRASWRLLCPTTRAGELRASWRLLCPTARTWQLRGSWQLGASWLRSCSLLSPRGWRTSKMRPCELILWLQTLQPVEVEVLSRRSRTRTLRPDPLGQECGRWSRKLEEIIILNHVINII
jgi:hypothetical protein